MNRKDFPLLKKYTYLDSASTALKPQAVLQAMNQFYSLYPINSHNMDSPLGIKVNQLMNQARQKIATLIDADSDEIIFTSGTTDGINKIAQMLKPWLQVRDEIVLSPYNHDSNILVWLDLAKQLNLKVIFSENLIDVINAKTRVIAYAQQNNTIQKYINRKTLLKKARQFGAIIINDSAQAIVHEKVSLQEADVIVFSGTKLYGPMGIGVLAITKQWQQKLNPVVLGSRIFSHFENDSWTYKQGHAKFESGTLNIGGIIGLGAAIDYFKTPDLYQGHEKALIKYAYDQLSQVPGIKIYSRKGDLNLLFNIKHYSPQDVVSYLGHRHIILRAGIHCAHMMAQMLHLSPSIRLSIGAYNNKQDINTLVKALLKGGDFIDLI